MLGSLAPRLGTPLSDQLVDHVRPSWSRFAQLAAQSLEDLLAPLEHKSILLHMCHQRLPWLNLQSPPHLRRYDHATLRTNTQWDSSG